MPSPYWLAHGTRSPPSFAAGFYSPEGQEQQVTLSLGNSWYSPSGGLRRAVVLTETRFVAEQPATSWQHLNERPLVEL